MVKRLDESSIRVPTLLEAAGIPVPASLHGRPVMNLLRGERREWPDHVFVQISEAQIGRAVRTARWKYSVCAPTPTSWRTSPASSRTEPWRTGCARFSSNISARSRAATLEEVGQ
jgi:arylsulfatase A-like enzyme